VTYSSDQSAMQGMTRNMFQVCRSVLRVRRWTRERPRRDVPPWMMPWEWRCGTARASWTARAQVERGWKPLVTDGGNRQAAGFIHEAAVNAAWTRYPKVFQTRQDQLRSRRVDTAGVYWYRAGKFRVYLCRTKELIEQLKCNSYSSRPIRCWLSY
jgi:hypothetical protein